MNCCCLGPTSPELYLPPALLIQAAMKSHLPASAIPAVVVLILGHHSFSVTCVGPDLRARTRLLRDLPLGLAGSRKPLLPKERDRTLIDMSLAIRSLDLNMESGTFRTDGWMSLKWFDPRYTWNPGVVHINIQL